ncbi:hypothetical protein KBD33_05920 [Candidatus Gracilibacteria bacterium]|nr:hypothetical protein [Candidatus Gracilibacteria bacterium]
MPLEFYSTAYWDAFIDEFRGVWEIAAHEGHYTNELQLYIKQRVRNATRIVIQSPENFEPYKGKIYTSEFSPEEIQTIRKLLGFPESVSERRNTQYG